MAGKRKSALSTRIDEAIQRSGLTNEYIAERMKLTAGNISHWRTGRHRPDVESTQRLAQIIGASDYYLLTGREDPAQLIQAFQAARALWKGAVERGEDPARAWEQILGQRGLFTDEERQSLARQSSELSEYLVSVDGLEWIELTSEQHRVVGDLIRMLARDAKSTDDHTDEDWSQPRA